MQVPLQITFRDVPASDALKAEIRAEAAKLEKFYPQPTRCPVVVEEERCLKHQGRHFNVRIDLRFPVGECSVHRQGAEDFYVAHARRLRHGAAQTGRLNFCR